MAQTLSEGPIIPDADGGERISATGVNELRTLGSSTNAALASVRADSAALAADAEASAAVAAQIGTDADSTSRARDLVLEGLIAGMEGMTYVGAWDSGTTYRINDVVTHGGDSWARLTTGATGEPGVSSTDWGLVARKGDGGGFGELNETETVGLYDTVDSGIEARLAAIEYDSGWRDITASITATPAPTGGTILVRRVGKHVYMQVNGITFADSTTSFITLSNSIIPAGLRPPRTVDFASARRLVGDTGGSIRVDPNGRGILYQVAGGYPILGTGSWVTDEAPPATPPGTPA